MSEKSKGQTSGAMQGAAAGASVGMVFGPWGAVIGGLVGGAYGAIAGGKAGKLGDRAKQTQQMANIIQGQREAEAYRQKYLNVLREGRIQRASSLAAAVAMGTEEGSGSQGALGAIGSQIANQIEYMSVDRGREILAAYLTGQATNLSQKSQDKMGRLSTTMQIVGAIGTAATLGASMSASAAATTASEAGVGATTQASGIGSSMATSTAASVSGSSGVVSAVGPSLPGSFSADVWTKASQQLMNRAMIQQGLFNATMQTSRAYYSGTRLVRA